MNPQDEHLCSVIDDAVEHAGRDNIALTDHIHDAIRAAGYSRPQVVESVEQLVALPVGSVVLTEQGGVYEARSTVPYQTWRETGSRYVHTPADLALPATVLYTPQEAK